MRSPELQAPRLATLTPSLTPSPTLPTELQAPRRIALYAAAASVVSKERGG